MNNEARKEIDKLINTSGGYKNVLSDKYVEDQKAEVRADSLDKKADNKNYYLGQSWLGMGGNMLAKFGTNAAGMALMSAGATIDVEQTINTIKGSEQEYSNMLYEWGKSIVDYGNENFIIKQQNPGSFSPFKPSWWAETIAQSGTSIGMMGEAAAETILFSALTGGFGAGASLASKATKARSMSKLWSMADKSSKFKRNAIAYATIRRHHEGVLEAADTFHSLKDKYEKAGKSKEESIELASKGAAKVYRLNMPLAILDAASFSLMSYNPLTNKGTDLLDKAFKGMSVGKRGGATLIANMAGEGFEEGYQHIAQGEGEHYADVLAGLSKTNTFGERMGKYVREDGFYNAMASGAVGGGIMAGGSKLIQKIQGEDPAETRQREYIDRFTTMQADISKKLENAKTPEEINKIKESLGELHAINAIHSDMLNNTNAGFETYTKFLEKSVELLEGNTSENQDEVYNEYTTLLNNAKKIKEIYDETVQEDGIYADIMIPIVSRKFGLEEINKNIQDVTNKLTLLKSTHSELKNLKPDEKSLISIKSKKEAYRKRIGIFDKSLSSLDNSKIPGVFSSRYLLLNREKDYAQNKLIGLEREEKELIEKIDNYRDVEQNQLPLSKSTINKLSEELVRLNVKKEKLDKDLKELYDRSNRKNHQNEVLNDKIDNASTKKELELIEKSEELDSVQKEKLNNKKSKLYIDNIDKGHTPPEINVEKTGKEQAEEILETDQIATEQENAKESNRREKKKGKRISKEEWQRNKEKKRRKEIEVNIEGKKPFSENLKKLVDDLNFITMVPGQDGKIVYTTIKSYGVVPSNLYNSRNLLPKEHLDWIEMGFKHATSRTFKEYENKLKGSLDMVSPKVSTSEAINDYHKELDERDQPKYSLEDKTSDFSKERMDKFKGIVKNLHDSFHYEEGFKPTFKDVMTKVKKTSLEKTKKYYYETVEAWKLNGYPIEDFEQTFRELYMTFEQAEDAWVEALTDVDVLDNVLVGINSQNKEDSNVENKPQLRVEEVDEEKPKDLNLFENTEVVGFSDVKLAHLSLYEGELNKGQYVDNTDVLDPEKYLEGEELTVEIPENHHEMLVPIWNKKTWQKEEAKTFGTYSMNMDENSVDFIGKIPMVVKNKEGKAVAFIHYINWYNPNTSDKYSIEESKRKLLNFRKQVINNGGKLKVRIKEKRLGVIQTLPEHKPIYEVSPNSVLGYFNTNGVFESADGKILRGDILNKKDIKIGHGVELRLVDVKDGRKKYLAFPYKYGELDSRAKDSISQAIRVFSLGQIGPNTVKEAKRGTLLYKLANGVHQGGNIYDIRDKVLENTNNEIDLFDIKGLFKFIEFFTLTNKSQGINKKEVHANVTNNSKIPDQTAYLNLNFRGDGELIFGVKRMLITEGHNSLSISPSLANVGNLQAYLNNTNKNIKLITGKILPKMKFGLAKSAFNAEMVFINKDGSVTESFNYNDYAKTKAFTNVNSYKINDGKTATLVQPTITIEPVLNKKVEVPQVQEVVNVEKPIDNIIEKSDLPVKEKEVVKSISDKNVDVTPLITDEVEGVEEYEQKEELTLSEIHHISTWVARQIEDKLGKQKKADKNTLLEDVKLSLGEIINPLKKLANSLIEDYSKLESRDVSININEQKEVLDNIRLLEENYDTILDKAFEMIKAQSSITVSEDLDINTDNTDEGIEKNWSKSSIENNPKKTIGVQVKKVLNSIPLYDKYGNVVTGLLNIPVYPGYNHYFNEVASSMNIGGLPKPDFNSFVSKISAIGKIDGESDTQLAWTKKLLEKLDKEEESVKNKFVTVFTKGLLDSTHAMIIKKGKNEYSNSVYYTNESDKITVIRKSFTEGFKHSNLVAVDGSLNKVVAKQVLQELKNLKGLKNSPLKLSEKGKKIQEVLSKVGLDLDTQVTENLLKGYKIKEVDGKKIITVTKKWDGEYGLFQTSKRSSGLFGKLIYELETLINKEEGVNFSNNPELIPFSDMTNILNTIARRQLPYSYVQVPLNYRDGSKNIYGFTQIKLANQIFDKLKHDEDYRANKKRIPFSSPSYILRLLEDPTIREAYSQNDLAINALKEIKKPLFQDTEMAGLSGIEQEFVKLVHFQSTNGMKSFKDKVTGLQMRMARMSFLTMSDKKGMFNLTVPVVDIKPKDIQSTNGGFSNALKKHIFDQLVKPEFERIISHHNEARRLKKDKDLLYNQEGYNKAAQHFNLVPAMNKLEYQGKKFIEYIGETDSEITEEVKSLIEKELRLEAYPMLESMFNELGNKKVQDFKDNKIFEVGKEEFFTVGVEENQQLFIKKNKLNISYVNSRKSNDKELQAKTIALDFIINSYIVNANHFMLMVGDIANYSRDKDYKRDFKTPYNPAIGDNFNWENFTVGTLGVNLGKRLASQIAPGDLGANSTNDKYLQFFLQDHDTVTRNMESLIKLYYGSIDSETRKHLDKLYSRDENEYTIGKRYLEDRYKDLSDYLDIEATDAQEYQTWEEHLNILHNHGKIDDSQLKHLTEVLSMQDQLTLEGKKIPKKYMLSYNDIKMVLQPIKPVYTGLLDEFGRERLVYIKSSTFTLFPQLTLGTELEPLRLGMMDLQKKTGKKVRMSYQTANKVGSVLKPNRLKIWNHLGEFNEGVFDDLMKHDWNKSSHPSSLVLDREFFRIQQDVPFKSGKNVEDKVTQGTQILKLLFGDGVSKIKENIFQYKGKPISGENLHKEYTKLYNKWGEIELQKLSEKFGGSGVEFYENLREILLDEAKQRDFNQNDLDAFDLKYVYDESGEVIDVTFGTPIWLNPNSDRFESLLNSIMTNRFINLKMPGNAYVLGSETGFKRVDELSDLSGILYTDKYEGELKPAVIDENGVLKAQVFVPSKFKLPSGKFIDMTRFTKVVGEGKNKKTVIDMDRIDPELLQIISFRIPTSSHVSLAVLEIVGFLPNVIGDLMVLPSNFTKQKGIDFDIDKETTYQYHHMLLDGKIRKLSREILLNIKKTYSDLEDKIPALKEDPNKFKEDLKSDIKALREQNKLLLEQVKQQESEIEKTELEEDVEDIEDIIDGYFDTIDSNKDTLDQLNALAKLTRKTSEQIDKLIEKSEIKFIQNNIIEINSSILGHPNIQEKINKVLSIDFAKKQSNEIDSMLNTSNYKSVLDPDYQTHKMGLGSSGKLGIGVYSNAVVLHSLISQSKKPIVLQQSYKSGMKILYKDLNLKIGSVRSNGTLGREYTITTNEKDRRKLVDYLAELQNTATDNEKEQIMGKVNVNKYTINYHTLMALLGFDKDTIKAKNEEYNGKVISLPYYILSQPIVKQYVKYLAENESMLDSSRKRTPLEILKGLGYNPKNTNTTFTSLTAKNLYEDLKNGTQKTRKDVIQLLGLLNNYSGPMGKIQQIISTNNGIGMSNIENNLRAEMMDSETKQKLIKNSNTLFEEDGVDTYVGSMLKKGLYSGVGYFNRLFPIQNMLIKTRYYNILAEISDKENLANKDKLHKIQKAFKSFIFSDSASEFLGNTPDKERYRLLKNDYVVEKVEEKLIRNYKNKNLSTYILELKNSGGSIAKYINNNSFMLSLTDRFDSTSKGETKYYTGINYVIHSNNVNDDFVDSTKYLQLLEMYTMNKPLPDYNGDTNYTTKKLALDLIKYSFLTGGNQGAVEFVKYVPNQILEEIGFNRNLRLWQKAFSAGENPLVFEGNTLLDSNGEVITGDSFLHKKTRHFKEQYLRHNPGVVLTKFDNIKDAKLGWEKIKFIRSKVEGRKVISGLKINLKKVPIKSIPDYLTIRQGGENLLFRLTGDVYVRLGLLGNKTFSEYSTEQYGESILHDNFNFVPKEPTNKRVERRSGKLFDSYVNTNLTTVVDKIIEDPNTFKSTKKMFELLKPHIREEVKVFESDFNGAAIVGSYHNNEINLNSNLVKTKKSELDKILLHETIHSIMRKDLEKYFDNNSQPIGNIKDMPIHVQRLYTVYDKIVGVVGRDKVNEFRKNYDPKNPSFNPGEEILYTVMDIHEATAGLFNNKNYRDLLLNTKMNNYESVFERLFSVIKDYVNKIINKNVPENLWEAMVISELDFMEQESKIVNVPTPPESLNKEEIGLSGIGKIKKPFNDKKLLPDFNQFLNKLEKTDCN